MLPSDGHATNAAPRLTAPRSDGAVLAEAVESTAVRSRMTSVSAAGAQSSLIDGPLVTRVQWGTLPFFKAARAASRLSRPSGSEMAVDETFEERLGGDATPSAGVSSRWQRKAYDALMHNAAVRGWVGRHRILAYALASTAGHTLAALFSALFLGVGLDLAFRPGGGIATPQLFMGPAFVAMPLAVLFDVARTAKRMSGRGGYAIKLAQVFVYLFFIALLGTAGLQSFDPNDRYAMRARVTDMVLDEYLLEGIYIYMYSIFAAGLTSVTYTYSTGQQLFQLNYK